MPDEFEDIPVAEAIFRLGLDRHFDGRTTLWHYDSAEQAIARIEADPEMKRLFDADGKDWRAFERRKVRHPFVVRHYPTHAVVAGAMDLDNGLGRDHLAGVVVDGDLELYGSLINFEPETWMPFVVVRGSLHCESLVVSGSHVTIRDHVMATNLVAITENHGELDVGGDVTAKYFVMGSDGDARVGGTIRAAGWAYSTTARVRIRRSEWAKEVLPQFRREFLDEEGRLRHHLAPYEALLEGREILRKT